MRLQWTPLKIMPGLSRLERGLSSGMIVLGAVSVLATHWTVFRTTGLVGLWTVFTWALGWLLLVVGVTTLAANNARELRATRLRLWVILSGAVLAATLFALNVSAPSNPLGWRCLDGPLWSACKGACLVSAAIWATTEMSINHKVKQALRRASKASERNDDATASASKG